MNEGESYYEWGEMLLLKKDIKTAKKKLIKSKNLLESIGTKKYISEIDKLLKKVEE